MRDALNFLTSTAHIAAGGQTLTVQAVSSNDINLGAASKQPGLSGRQLYVHIRVAVAAHANDATCAARFELVHDSVALVAGAVDVILATNSLVGADLVAGAQIVFTIPPGVFQQFMGWQWSPSEAWNEDTLQVISWIDDVAPDELTIVS